jgi:predicted metal-dependent enzyme (double-stranded beta helix superfamily)
MEVINLADTRRKACQALFGQAHAITAAEGVTEASLAKIKTLLLAFAARGDSLFPKEDFPLPHAQGCNHIVDVEENDGLYVGIALPGKEAAIHDHGVWCVNAGLAGRELHKFYRRTDAGSREGFATVEEIGQSLLAPGLAMAMTDHALHRNDVVGDAPSYHLALYGYAIARFPAVVWYHPEYSTVRASASRRGAEAA